MKGQSNRGSAIRSKAKAPTCQQGDRHQIRVEDKVCDEKSKKWRQSDFIGQTRTRRVQVPLGMMHVCASYLESLQALLSWGQACIISAHCKFTHQRYRMAWWFVQSEPDTRHCGIASPAFRDRHFGEDFCNEWFISKVWYRIAPHLNCHL